MSKGPGNPTVMVVAYNRPYSLVRMLNSLSKADYEGYKDISLIISVDYSDCREVLDVANQFSWNYGSKQVIAHKTRLGLRKHIIFCGDLTKEYESIVLLEDDISVSPVFYDYAVKAMNHYSDDERVGGISLYSYNYNEIARLRFLPLEDGYDNYFIQTASSWGQLWTYKQWQAFKEWYESNANIPNCHNDPIPHHVRKWPESSWKKYYNRYLALKGKYFVYPRVSLSTNFGDIGTHQRRTSSVSQTTLLLGRKEYCFSQLESSRSIYDCHYEIEQRCVKSYCPELEQFDFECDLYGTKDLAKVKSEYLISLRECDNPLYSYSLGFLPHELNVIFSLKGEFFHFAKVSDFNDLKEKKRLALIRYLNTDLGIRRYGMLFVHEILERLGLL